MENQCRMFKKFFCLGGDNIANQKNCVYFMSVFVGKPICLWQREVGSSTPECNCKKAQLDAEKKEGLKNG